MIAGVVIALISTSCTSVDDGIIAEPDDAPVTTLRSSAPPSPNTSVVEESSAGGAIEPEDESAVDQPDTSEVPPPIEWESCRSGECASVTVPIDHGNPTGPTMELALARRRATGESRGAIFVNFGGPGGATVDRIATYELPGGLGADFDLIGWDPRGVGGSGDLNCADVLPDEPTTLTDGSDGYTDEVDAAIAVWDEVMGCAAQSPFIDHIGTAAVANDLEFLRRSLGDDKLNYLGFSYGTEIGWVYASLFPDQVGRMVLDGGVLPGTFSIESELTRYPVFDDAFRRLDIGCDNSSDCALQDAGFSETVARLFEELEADPIPVDGGETFGPVDLLNVVVGSTYLAPEFAGPFVSDIVARVDDGDVGGAENFLQLLSDGFEPAVFWSVTCADGAGVDSDQEAVDGFEALSLSAPATVGNAVDVAYCHRFPGQIVGLPDLDTTGAGPILVVGNTGDPATPYPWSVELAARLDDGHLLTYHGGGHTISGNDECIDAFVTAYVAEGHVPPENAQCGRRPTVIGVNLAEVENGLRVEEVGDGSPAERGGIQVGDIIQSVEGAQVRSVAALPSAEPGVAVVIDIIRDNEEIQLDIIPELAPAAGWFVPIVPQEED